MTQAKTKAGCSIVPLDRQVKREAVMTFEKWFEQYAPTAPEHLDDCAADSWNAAIECAAAICDERANVCESKTVNATDSYEVNELRSIAWQFSVLAEQIRNMAFNAEASGARSVPLDAPVGREED